MRYRLGSLLAVLGLAVILGTAAAQQSDNTKNQGNAYQVQSFEGKIGSIDASKHEILVQDARVVPSPTATRPTGAPGNPPSGAGTSDRGLGRNETTNRGTTGSGMMTFHAASTARITLDGRTTTFSELKQGQFVRIMARSAENPNPKTGAPGAGATRTEDRGANVRGPVLMAERIDAFTQAPPGFNSGARQPGSEKP
jgi:hypothetical protein